MIARGSWDGARRAALGVAAGTVTVAAATGLGVQLGVLDTSEVRWVHHLLYGASMVTSVVAALAQAGFGARHRAAMAPAVAVLMVLGRTGGGTSRHGVVGAIATASSWSGALVGR